MTQKSTHSLRTLFAEADKQLETAKKDLAEVKNFIARLSEIGKNMETLEAFYHDDNWMQGREDLQKQFPGEYFESAGEDSIWDVSQEFYFQKIKLMKLLADDLYNTTPDGYR